MKYKNIINENVLSILLLVFCIGMEFYIVFHSFFNTIITSAVIRALVLFSVYTVFFIFFYFFKKGDRKFYTLIFFSFIFYVFLLKNRSMFVSNDLVVLKTNSVISTLNKYEEGGNILFTTSHNSYFLSYYILYALSMFTGLEYYQSIYLLLFVYIFMIFFISLIYLKYFNNRYNKSIDIVICLLMFFIVCSNIVVVQNRSFYRDIGMIFMMMHFLLEMQYDIKNPKYLLLNLLFLVGSSISSPIASMILIILYFFRYLLEGKSLYLLFILIPLSYFGFVSQKYYELLIVYGKYAVEGIVAFLVDTILGQLENITPWSRVSSTLLYDSYINMFFNIMTLMLSSFVFYLFINRLIQQRARANVNKKFIAYNLHNLLFLIITVFVIIGSYALGERTYSDIRTINIIFITSLVPFTIVEALKENVVEKKSVRIIVIILLLCSFPRIIYNYYPKNVNDPINVVEDARIAQFSFAYAGLHITNHFENGLIIGDYKMNRELSSIYNRDQYFTKMMIGINITDYIDDMNMNAIVAFSIKGSSYPSIYIEKETYEEAIRLMYDENCIYDDSQIKMIFKNDD